jgi:hypothetical protein
MLSEKFEKLEVEEILSNYAMVKGKCVLVLLSTIFNHFA